MRLMGTTVLALVAVTLIANSERYTAAAQEPGLSCIAMRTDRMPLDDRRSPLDSVSFEVAGSPVKITSTRMRGFVSAT